MCMHVYTCICVCMCVYVYICMYVLYVCIPVCGCVHVYLCVRVFTCACGYVLQRFEPVGEDLDLLREIQTCTRYGPDSLAIWKLIHEMIWRFVLVRAVKTRWWSDLKSCHFMWVFVHVSFTYLSLSVLSICYLYHFMWPSDLFYQYDYLYHFMRHQRAFTLFIQLIWAFISIISCVSCSTLLT